MLIHRNIRQHFAYAALGISMGWAPVPSTAKESIEFVSEHLAEVPMDNRFAVLPLWGQDYARRWQVDVGAAFAHTGVDTLTNEGPMLTLGLSRQFTADTRVTAFGFVDDLRLSSGLEHRPLAVLFARDVPLALPSAAEFSGLAGSERQVGFGFALRRSAEMRWWHSFQWTAGVLWQRISLQDFSFDYRLLDGPDAGATGIVDYSTTYSHITPFAGLAWPRMHGNWELTPHVLLALPLPRHGVAGRITGATFDLRGDTDSSGAGKHFGDSSLTIGFDVTFRPLNLTLDVGCAVTQALLEPVINEGVTSNWLVSVRWTY